MTTSKAISGSAVKDNLAYFFVHVALWFFGVWIPLAGGLIPQIVEKSNWLGVVIVIAVYFVALLRYFRVKPFRASPAVEQQEFFKNEVILPVLVPPKFNRNDWEGKLSRVTLCRWCSAELPKEKYRVFDFCNTQCERKFKRSVLFTVGGISAVMIVFFG